MHRQPFIHDLPTRCWLCTTQVFGPNYACVRCKQALIRNTFPTDELQPDTPVGGSDLLTPITTHFKPFILARNPQAFCRGNLTFIEVSIITVTIHSGSPDRVWLPYDSFNDYRTSSHDQKLIPSINVRCIHTTGDECTRSLGYSTKIIEDITKCIPTLKAAGIGFIAPVRCKDTQQGKHAQHKPTPIHYIANTPSLRLLCIAKITKSHKLRTIAKSLPTHTANTLFKVTSQVTTPLCCAKLKLLEMTTSTNITADSLSTPTPLHYLRASINFRLITDHRLLNHCTQHATSSVLPPLPS